MGDRIVCEAFRETIAGEFGPVDPSLSGVLASVFHLHLLNSVEKDLSTFLASDLLNSSQAEQGEETSRRLCAELTPSSLALIESFGLPEEMLQSPIPLTGWATTRMTTKESCKPMPSSRRCSTAPSQTSLWATATSRDDSKYIMYNFENEDMHS